MGNPIHSNLTNRQFSCCCLLRHVIATSLEGACSPQSLMTCAPNEVKRIGQDSHVDRFSNRCALVAPSFTLVLLPPPPPTKMEGSISTSASTIRTLHFPYPESSTPSISQQSSPRSSALPSPPDSPSSDSVSSLPSVSSSFFFSSGAPNSPQPSDNDPHEHETTQGLIIPSLMLPPALRQPTNFGKTIGDVRLIVIAGSAAGPSFTTKLLLEENEDIVDFDPWEQLDYGRMLRASTDWEAQHDPHGLENYEPARNIEILELPGYSQTDNVSDRACLKAA